MATDDPFVKFKLAQKEMWAGFGQLEILTTPAASHLVGYASVSEKDTVLDVACGTGVVTVTAARTGAKVKGLDLSPVLLERARFNASLVGAEIEFIEGDVEALPYPDASFDVVLSQFGHMFAPRPAVAISEMLRVLKPGGRIAFSTWPPELYTGLMFALVSRYQPPPPEMAPPIQWGDPNVVRERLGNAVENLGFGRELLLSPTLSPQHFRHMMESAAGPLSKLVDSMKKENPTRLAKFRSELDDLIVSYMRGNAVKQDFLMSRATKRR